MIASVWKIVVILIAFSVSIARLPDVTASNTFNCNRREFSRVHCLVEWSATDNRIAIRTGEVIEIWNGDLSEKMTSINLPQNVPSVMEWSADGRYLAMMNGTFNLFLWDSATDELQIENYHDAITQQFDDAGIQGQYDMLDSLSWRPDHNTIAFTHNGSVSHLDMEIDRVTVFYMRAYDASDYAGLVIWNDKDATLVTISAAGIVNVYDAVTLELISTSILPSLDLGGSWPLAQSIVLVDDRIALPAKNYIVEDNMLVERKSVVAVFNLRETELEAMLDTEADVINSISWNDENNLLAVGTGDWLFYDNVPGNVQVWDMETLERVETIDYELPVYSVDWNFGGSKLAVSVVDGSITVVNISD